MDRNGISECHCHKKGKCWTKLFWCDFPRFFKSAFITSWKVPCSQNWCAIAVLLNSAFLVYFVTFLHLHFVEIMKILLWTVIFFSWKMSRRRWKSWMPVELHGKIYASGTSKWEQMHTRASAGFFASRFTLPVCKATLFFNNLCWTRWTHTCHLIEILN